MRHIISTCSCFLALLLADGGLHANPQANPPGAIQVNAQLPQERDEPVKPLENPGQCLPAWPCRSHASGRIFERLDGSSRSWGNCA